MREFSIGVETALDWLLKRPVRRYAAVCGPIGAVARGGAGEPDSCVGCLVGLDVLLVDAELSDVD